MKLKELGQRIRQLRKEKGYSQERLGNKADLSTFFISNLENGKRGIRLYSLIKIAEALDEPLHMLLVSDDQPFAITPEERSFINQYRRLKEPFKGIVEQLLYFNKDNVVYYRKQPPSDLVFHKRG